MNDTIPIIAEPPHGSNKQRKTASISCGFEQLLCSSPLDRTKDVNFEVVIVGSGYGGAIAAAELAGCRTDPDNGDPVTVCVLERGLEYLPGMFPSRMSDLAGHVRFSSPNAPSASGKREGLLDLRVGGDVNALVANGLGGGSLINAGVMVVPDDDVFARDAAWPDAFKNASMRKTCYDEVKELLGSAIRPNLALDAFAGPQPRKTPQPIENTIDLHREGRVAKMAALEALARGGAGAVFAPAPLSMVVTTGDDRGPPGAFGTCKRCGDCATGCNQGAKNSLDANLLARAHARGAKIYTGATVLRIERDYKRDAWCLEVVHTHEKLRKRQGGPFKLYARKVILAAGTFGSTEILLRSNCEDLPISPRLGQGFSGNGDTIAALYNRSSKNDVNSVVDETIPFNERKVGPTITGILKTRSKNGLNVVIEELAIPGALKRTFEEVITTSHVLHTLDERDIQAHTENDLDPCAVDPEAMKRTSVFALMGDDGAQGAIELVGSDDETHGDGAVRVRWPEIRSHPLFEAQLQVLRTLAHDSGVGGTVLPNPMWRFVPQSMEILFDGKHGPAFTVHPLGGCAMGDDWTQGVVDGLGRVFKGSTEADRQVVTGGEKPYWKDLVVLDGSIIPGALGVNPALTIAALALHSIRLLRDDWKFAVATGDAPAIKPAPIFLKVEIDRCAPKPITQWDLIERMHGAATLETPLGPERCIVELTLKFSPFPLTHITGSEKKALDADPASSLLRIYREKDWRRARRLGWPEERLAASARITAPLSGTLTVFRREATEAGKRRWRALWAWWCNRGARDSWQWLFGPKRKGTDSISSTVLAAQAPQAQPPENEGWWAKMKRWFRERWEQIPKAVRAAVDAVRKKWNEANALASHGGEVRRFDYVLTVGKVTLAGTRSLNVTGLHETALITGAKRLTYARRCNPFRQLQEMSLADFPGLQAGARTPVLELDTKYLGEQGVPLLRIVDQPDQPAALGDVAALAAYLARVFIKVHVWSFRRPDTPEPREPQRLPGIIRGTFFRRYEPSITELEVDKLPDGTPVRVRLTNYRPRKPSAEPPIVMLHGYSASGTTFAHDAVRPNLATYFLARNRDVWIVDLRTSSGMPTARHPWTFEDAALADIPAALDHIVRETVRERGGDDNERIDVIAHCMGSAMFSMAVLAWPSAGDRFFRQRQNLHKWIRRAVLSQVGPLVEFSPANVLRGYVLSYIRHFLPIDRYEFRTGPDPSLADQLIDRLLAALPYPEEEFDIENPPWWTPWRCTPFVGTRHRMDALYARDFNLKNIPPKVLDHIDDLFGPLSIDTVSQGIHFARNKVITDRSGRNVFVSRRQLKDRWIFPTLSVHGEDNGLSDVSTLAHMRRGFRDAGNDKLRTRMFKGYGHQDSLIGRDAGQVFDEMARFLEEEAPSRVRQQRTTAQVIARIPWIGPHQGVATRDGVPIRAGTDPGPNKAGIAAFLPVNEVEVKGIRRFELVRDGNGDLDWKSVRLHAAPQHRDGWIRLDIPFDEAAIRGAQGVLMLLLHDEPRAMESALFSPKYKKLRAYLRGLQLPWGVTDYVELKRTAIPRIDEWPEADREEFLTYLTAITPPLQIALAEVLEEKSSEELRPALIEVRKKGKADAERGLCFAFGSCQYPAGILDGEVADRSMRLLAKRLDDAHTPKPDFLVLLGDQVYVDATAGLFDPAAHDDRYVKPYERMYQRKGLQSVLRRLPTYMMLDDHEIDDNWEPGVDDVRTDPSLPEARRSYWRYQRLDKFANAGRERDPDLSLPFEEAGVPFFLADTRTRRTARTATTVGAARIMDDAKFKELLDWLTDWHGKAPHLPKFVASSAILLPRHLRATGDGCIAGALRSDGWDGYPYSLHRLLAHIARKRIANVVFLSGDEHLSCVARAEIAEYGAEPVIVHSIHSSALYAPYPFANADRSDFEREDRFDFDSESKRYHCRVHTDFAPPGDGFAILATSGRPDASLSCEFVREGNAGVCTDLKLADVHGTVQPEEAIPK